MIYRYLLKRGQYVDYLEVQESLYEHYPLWKTFKVISVSELKPLKETITEAENLIAELKSYRIGKTIK